MRGYFLDVSPESVGASEIIGTTKIELRKRTDWWEIIVWENVKEEWMEVSRMEYTEKELRSMYHLLSIAK